MSPPVFEARSVVRRYDGALALGPVDLTIEEGSTTALIGPSGAASSSKARFRRPRLRCWLLAQALFDLLERLLVPRGLRL